MVVETEQNYRFDQFPESGSLPSEMDVELMRTHELPDDERRGSNLLVITGIIAALAGLGLLADAIFNIGMGPLIGLLAGTGVVALGIGGARLLGKLFRRRGLNLPTLKVKRKAELRNSPPKSSQPIGTFRSRSSRLFKSTTDKVIMGVCGGLAEHTGISAALIRILFIAAFAITGGTAVLVYFLAAFILPSEDKVRL